MRCKSHCCKVESIQIFTCGKECKGSVRLEIGLVEMQQQCLFVTHAFNFWNMVLISELH
jgi:hypothetical protein